jgi:hypothetical protein
MLPISSGRFSHINYQKKDDALLIVANGMDNVYCWNGTGAIAKLAADAPWLSGFPDADIESDLIRLTNHALKVGDAVAFYGETGRLPGGLAALDTYFVKSKGTDTFTVGTSKSGSTKINIKTKGTKGWRVAKVAWLGAPNTPTANSSTILFH